MALPTHMVLKVGLSHLLSHAMGQSISHTNHQSLSHSPMQPLRQPLTQPLTQPLRQSLRLGTAQGLSGRRWRCSWAAPQIHRQATGGQQERGQRR